MFLIGKSSHGIVVGAVDYEKFGVLIILSSCHIIGSSKISKILRENLFGTVIRTFAVIKFVVGQSKLPIASRVHAYINYII